MITHSVDDDPDSHAIKIGKNLTSNGTISQLLISESSGRDLRSDKGDIFGSEMGELNGVSKEGSVSPEASFMVGRVGNKNETVVGLNRPNRNKNKSKGPLRNKTEPSSTKPTPAIKRSPRKGILNTQEGACEQGGAMQLDNKYVAKRKHEYACMSCDESMEIKKKIRMEEETRQLSVLLAEHLGSAEAAGQPRRAQ